MDCIFCKIIKGEIDSAKVYEDQDVIVILDIYPLTKGHCLVIPKNHFDNIFDVKENILQKIILAAKKISEKIKKSLNVDGINLLQSTGSTAGQAIFHFHLHIIPRYKGDGLVNHFGKKPQRADIEEIKRLAEKIKLT